jgi:hypothetical protein
MEKEIQEFKKRDFEERMRSKTIHDKTTHMREKEQKLKDLIKLETSDIRERLHQLFSEVGSSITLGRNSIILSQKERSIEKQMKKGIQNEKQMESCVDSLIQETERYLEQQKEEAISYAQKQEELETQVTK